MSDTGMKSLSILSISQLWTGNAWICLIESSRLGTMISLVNSREKRIWSERVRAAPSTCHGETWILLSIDDKGDNDGGIVESSFIPMSYFAIAVYIPERQGWCSDYAEWSKVSDWEGQLRSTYPHSLMPLWDKVGKIVISNTCPIAMKRPHRDGWYDNVWWLETWGCFVLF